MAAAELMYHSYKDMTQKYDPRVWIWKDMAQKLKLGKHHVGGPLFNAFQVVLTDPSNGLHHMVCLVLVISSKVNQ